MTLESNVDTFNEFLQSIFKKTRNTNKTMHWCGDYNLDLLKQGTKRFLNVMYSYDLYPLMTKPNRISEFSATLIDNFTKGLANACKKKKISCMYAHRGKAQNIKITYFKKCRKNIIISKASTGHLKNLESTEFTN